MTDNELYFEALTNIEKALKKNDKAAYGYTWQFKFTPDEFLIHLEDFLSQNPKWDDEWSFFCFMSTEFGMNQFTGKMDQLVHGTTVVCFRSANQVFGSEGVSHDTDD
jgi:hypothetical protein